MRIEGGLIAGKYRVSKKLGEGAMGSVWLAKNEVTDREFAIKILLPAVASVPAGLARFFREARLCGSLRHPSILEIYDAGSAPELDVAAYLVMERLDGAAVDVVIRQLGALDPRLAMDIVIHCARGLQLAHEKGIVHRDLKPANIFLHRPGTGALEPKVLDFGISKVLGTAEAPEIALTQSSTVLGSPLYMSPEQMEMKTLDARSDVHALGVVLWECLTGKPPFKSTTYNALVVEIMREPRPKLRDVLPGASPELAAIVERAIEPDRNDRFPSADAFADALEVELATLGGGIVELRTAAKDLLGGVDLATRPPPPLLHSSTTQPISVDPGSRTSVPVSEEVATDPEAALVATKLAPVADPKVRLRAPTPVVVSSAAPPELPRSSSKAIAGGALVLALAAVVAVVAASLYRAPAPPSAVSVASPSATVARATAAPPVSSAVEPVPAVHDDPVVAKASVPPATSALPEASASPALVTTPTGITTPARRPVTAARPATPTLASPPNLPAAPVHSAARPVAPSSPRIDESGL